MPLSVFRQGRAPIHSGYAVVTALFLLALCLFGLGLTRTLTPASAGGPTAYPSASNATGWPGVGPIAYFSWMPIYREQFWRRRAEDAGDVVLVGDSLTQNWTTATQDMRPTPVANRGIGGDVSRGVLFRIDQDVLDLKPRGVVLLVGTNDLTAQATPALIEANLQDILKAIRARTQAPIIFCTIPPSRNPQAPVNDADRQTVNQFIRSKSGRDGIYLLDLSNLLSDPGGAPVAADFGPDQLHPSAAAYRIWAANLKVVLAEANLR
jgi:lysophospholipase L1-like esterase